MKPGLFRDALLVAAPVAAALAGLASVDHRQRLVEAGYRVGALERESEGLRREVDHRRAVVAGLSSPVRLLAESRARNLGLDYPVAWNRVEGSEEAARLLSARAKPATGKSAPSKGKPVATSRKSRKKGR